MNIQNISALAKQLEVLGFEKAGSALSKRICFKPQNFHLVFDIDREKDKLSFLLHFEKNNTQDCYELMFHDAVLKKAIIIPETTVGGVNIGALEKQIASVNWKQITDLNEVRPWNVDDKASWRDEEKVEGIIEALQMVQGTEHGKTIASSLKAKYWNDLSFSEFEFIIL